MNSNIASNATPIVPALPVKPCDCAIHAKVSPCPLPRIEQKVRTGEEITDESIGKARNPLGTSYLAKTINFLKNSWKILSIRLLHGKSFMSPGKSFTYEVIEQVKRYYVDVAGEFQMVGAARFLVAWTRKKNH